MARPTAARLRFVVSKVAWCRRQVGWRATARGSLRLLRLLLTRPRSSSVRAHKSDLLLTFDYPSQLIPTLVLFGDLLEPELAIVEERLGPGDVAVDIGASIGTWTMMAARTGATVHACEPDAVSLRVLQDNVRVNGLGSVVRTHAVAVGAGAGRATVERRARSYLNSITETDGSEDGVPLTTLTQFLDERGIGDVAVLKVNTAGHEAAVLRGALPALRAGRVQVAMLLDGVALRGALAESHLDGYDVGLYDPASGSLVTVEPPFGFEVARPTPMNHYLVLRRRQVQD